MFKIDYTPDKLGLEKDELKYYNPNTEFGYELVFITGHIYSLKLSGYANHNDASVGIRIIEKISDRLREQGYEGHLHGIIDAHELKGVSPEARKLTLRRLLKWEDFDAYVLVGGSNFLKNIFKLFKRFNSDFKIYFSNDTDEALGVIKNIISGYDIKTSGENIESRLFSKPEWEIKSPTGDYKVKISLLDEDIFIVEPYGYAEEKDIDLMAELFEKVTQEVTPNKQKYYRIQDYSKMTGASMKARKRFIAWMRNNISKMHLSVFYDVDRTMKTIVMFGKLIYPHVKNIFVVESIREALNIVNKHKRGLEPDMYQKYLTHESLDELVVPETKEEMERLIKILVDENRELKVSNEVNSRKLFEIIARISWDYQLESDNNVVNETTDDSFLQLYHAIQMLQHDVVNLLKEREDYIKQVLENEEKYKKLVESFPDIIMLSDLDGSIIYGNKHLKTVLGIKEADYNNPDRKAYIHPDDIQLFNDAKNDLLNNSKLLTNVIENRFIDTWGNTHWMNVTMSKIFLSGELFIQKVLRDVTERKHIEVELEKHRNELEKLVKIRTDDLQKAKQKAEDADHLKTLFLANMSHEIRTPMNVIIGFADLLLDEDLTKEKRQNYIGLINKSSATLLKLINDIIDLAKIEANQLIIEKEDVAVKPMLEDIFLQFTEEKNRLEKYDIELIYNEACITDDVFIKTDTQRMVQVITNLLNNALKFTEEGEIEIGCQEKHEEVIFYVRDTGIGLPEGMLDMAFDRFRQVDESSTKEYGGAGLGLTISKSIVELLGGQIWVDESVKSGSKFCFSMPRVVKQENSTYSTEKKYPVKPVEYNWSSKSILIVEDEEANYRVLYEILSKTGVNILWVDNGQKAVEACENEKIDLILMDIQLPILNGYEATKKIRKMSSDIVIIAQTAYAMAGEEEKCLAVGCNAYIAKPLRKSQILNLISKYFL